MISVERIPEIPYSNTSTKYTEETNNNSMIGASIGGDSRSSKQTGSKLLDNDTLLVILSTALNTRSTSRLGKQTNSQPHTQRSTVSSHSHSLPRQTAAAEIDFKIEKAMDSVKMELLFTVRKEVRQLKSQVALLQVHNRYLEQENRILRSAAAPETLAKLNSRNPTSTLPQTGCTST